MASPVPRFYVLASKYVAVVTVALLTAVANLLAMFVTLWASRLLPLLGGGEGGFPWLTMFQIFGLLVLFSGFFSAVLLSLTSFAKSFKEAQAYLIPVMLVSLAPAMLSLMPGVKLSGALAIAPLINIVLLARDLLSGTADPAAALAAIISTSAYAGGRDRYRREVIRQRRGHTHEPTVIRIAVSTSDGNVGRPQPAVRPR